MSNTARANILARLREPQRPECGFSERDYLSRYDWDTAERVRRFTERMVAVRAEVHHATPETWLHVVSQVCAAKGLNNLLVSPETVLGKHHSGQQGACLIESRW